MHDQFDVESIIARHFAAQATAADSGAAEIQDRKFVEAVARGLSILEAFGRRPGAIGNNELHELTNLSKPTVTRLTHTLVTLGYLRRGSNTRYELTPRVMALARPYVESAAGTLPGAALCELAAGGPWSIAIAELSAGTLIVTASYSSHHTGTPSCPTGTKLDLANTAAGRAWLAAFRSGTQPLASVANDAVQLPPELIAAARAELSSKGFCFETGNWRRGVAAIAVPILGLPGSSRVAMGMTRDEPTFCRRLTKELAPKLRRLFP
jgi:DNA-binding IclR family transcriptional regulator